MQYTFHPKQTTKTAIISQIKLIFEFTFRFFSVFLLLLVFLVLFSSNSFIFVCFWCARCCFNFQSAKYYYVQPCTQTPYNSNKMNTECRAKIKKKKKQHKKQISPLQMQSSYFCRSFGAAAIYIPISHAAAEKCTKKRRKKMMERTESSVTVNRHRLKTKQKIVCTLLVCFSSVFVDTINASHLLRHVIHLFRNGGN